MLRQKSTDLVQGILCCGELVQQLIVVRLQLIQHLGGIFHPLIQTLISKKPFWSPAFPPSPGRQEQAGLPDRPQPHRRPLTA